MLGGDSSSSLVSSRWSGSDAALTSGNLVIDVRHFVMRNLAFGVYFNVGASESRGYGADSSVVRLRRDLVSGGVIVGYNVPLGDTVSLFPAALFGVHRSHQSTAIVSGSRASITASASGADEVEHSGPWLQITLPLYLHPVPHFFVAIGPTYYRDGAAELSDAGVSGRRSSIGIDVRFGGWWGGPRVEGDRSVATRARQFGEMGQFVLTNELGLGAGYSWYSGTDGWDAGISVTPGFDYFVADHVSLGASGQIEHTESVGFDGSRKVTSKFDTYALGPRIGADLPLAGWLSLYLRSGLLFGSHSFTETSSGRTNSLTYHPTRVYVSLHAMIHTASHLFVGIGPSLGSELESKDQYDRSNRQTALQLSALVGGWI
jgi:hypothetical protein